MIKARKKIDPERVLYDLDASFQTDLLKRPGEPKGHVNEMLRDLAKRDRSTDTTVKIRAEARDLLKDGIANHAADELEAALGGLFEDGVMFRAMSAAVGIRDKALSVAISKAFALAKLDPAAPSDWFLLLSRFCWAHFGEPGRPGAKRTWSEKEYRRLLQAVHQAKLAINSSEDATALRWLIKRKIYNLSPERLKTALRQARDPDFNRALVIPMFNALTADLPLRTKSLTDAEEAELRRTYGRVEADKIGASSQDTVP